MNIIYVLYWRLIKKLTLKSRGEQFSYMESSFNSLIRTGTLVGGMSPVSVATALIFSIGVRSYRGLSTWNGNE